MFTELIINEKLAWDESFKTATHEYFIKLSDEAVKELVAVTNAEFAVHEKEQFILKDSTNRAETVFGLDLGDPQ